MLTAITQFNKFYRISAKFQFYQNTIKRKIKS